MGAQTEAAATNFIGRIGRSIRAVRTLLAAAAAATALILGKLEMEAPD